MIEITVAVIEPGLSSANILEYASIFKSFIVCLLEVRGACDFTSCFNVMLLLLKFHSFDFV